MIGIEFIFRLIGMVVLALLAGSWGISLGVMASAPKDLYTVVLGLLGALVGLVLTPYITTRPARTLVRQDIVKSFHGRDFHGRKGRRKWPVGNRGSRTSQRTGSARHPTLVEAQQTSRAAPQ